jgi:3-hydroxybutyryl-CoA dehydratase
MEQVHRYYLEDLTVGMSDTVSKQVTADDIEAFAGVTGDTNPVHLDADYAETTLFKERIAHGMLTAGYISAVLGTRLPGPGCIYLSQSLKFRAPVKIGDEVTAHVTVTDVDPTRKRIHLETRCLVGETVVVDGEAILLVQSRPAQVSAAE